MNSLLKAAEDALQTRLAVPARSKRLRAVELSPTTTYGRSRATFTAAGITADYIPLDGQDGFVYQWVGRTHYLALHDLRLAGGETLSDASPVRHRNNLCGSITFLPAGCRIWGWSIPKSAHQSFTALYLDPRRMEDEVMQKLQNVPAIGHVYFSDQALRLTLDKIRTALSGPEAWDSMHLESLCLLSVLELCIYQRERVLGAAPRGLSKSSQEKIREYVEANLNRDIGLNDLAKLAGLSRFHFLRVFKETTRETPYQYLLRCRIERAHDLLRAPGLSVAEIARQVGFKDATQFIRAFRRLSGTTPGRFRK